MTTHGDPVAAFTEVAASHPRCVWLDGGGARAGSRRAPTISYMPGASRA